MSKEYFSHDVDAISDIKIVKMMQDYDFTGFGWYWAIVAELYKNGGHYYFDDLNILAKNTGIKLEKLKAFIEKCINKYTYDDKGLFVSDDKRFWSDSLQKRIEIREKHNTRKTIGQEDKIKLDKFEHVNLTEEDYNKFLTKYGEKLFTAGLEELEKWLVSPSPKAKQVLNQNHRGYFLRQDTWVIKNAVKKVKETGTNWSI